MSDVMLWLGVGVGVFGCCVLIELAVIAWLTHR
jgi:hypothetical protein